ncbi:uncharacterized protein F4822DRAFT_443511 [Hypoxylon trugodes]|uniref:uncharacterized protein n=1 Tax=Hypoxylon trugodes TaxID=326681 RepID=UPI00218D4B63|nr:uncharacterized protein F4822DRAFT_443511 [Hypoxylon trugodes]KAI1388628.1 hypothetical protein F4822DRAFT_443511 [Hypoxylon trugodes]
MKVITILHLLLAMLGATLAISGVVPGNNTFEIRVRRNETSGHHKNNHKKDNSTLDPLHSIEDPKIRGSSRPTQMFDLAAASTNKLNWPYPRVIPVSHTGCTDWPLQVDKMKVAVQNMIEWNDNGGEVEPRWLHAEIHGHVGVYQCNCKWMYYDKAPASEMWEFFDRLEDECGVGQSGWIFSEEWEKGWAIATAKYIQTTSPPERLCPEYCCGI